MYATHFTVGANQHPMPAELRGWIETLTEEQPPPFFTVAEPHESKWIQSPLAVSPQSVNRRFESGVFEISFRGHPNVMRQSAKEWLDYFSQIRSLDEGRSFDRRTLFLADDATHSEVVLADIRTGTSDVPGNLPVVGPGGRIILYQGAETIDADVVIRRRDVRIPARWRNPARVVRGLEQELADEPETVEIFAQFGYLELSKYEPQSLLRPAFIFVIQTSQVRENQLRWQYAIAQPATVNENVPIEEGLGTLGDRTRD